MKVYILVSTEELSYQGIFSSPEKCLEFARGGEDKYELSADKKYIQYKRTGYQLYEIIEETLDSLI